MFFFLNTVSYAAMTLRAMMEEEMAYYSSPEFIKVRDRQRRHETLMAIFQQIRSGKKLPMFADHHRIKPQKLVDAASI
jgi:uncharacterized protein (DUF2249 family)